MASPWYIAFGEKQFCHGVERWIRLLLRPSAAKALWLDATWWRGRYGLPLPPPIHVSKTERLLIPPGLREEIIEDDDDKLAYRVKNTGWLTTYPVSYHRGDVKFEADGDATRMVWTVEYEPYDEAAAVAWTAFLTRLIPRVS